MALAVIMLLAIFALAGCGVAGQAGGPEPPNVGLSVTSGGFTTTVRTGKVAVVPFSETVIVRAAFDHPVYGSANQTAAYATVSPTTYRIEPHTPRNSSTFTFALTNRTPGTVEISIYENRDAVPVVFTLQIGE